MTLLAVLAAMGAPWAVLQSIAWERMLADNLGHTSFLTALRQTFDGRHPCELCKAISVGKNSEQKQDLTRQHRKLEFPPQPAGFQPRAPETFRILTPTDTFADALPAPPPTPPPRGHFA